MDVNTDSNTVSGTTADAGGGEMVERAGTCGATTLPTDQRGFTRGAGGVCDSGAYEYAGVASALRHRPVPAKPARRRAGKTPVPLPHLKHLKIHTDP